MTMGMGFPMGMGIPYCWVMGIGDKIGNGNGKEWETICMEMGMAIIPKGINSHRRIQCEAYVIVQFIVSLLW